MTHHFHHWHFGGPKGKAYDRLTRSSEGWRTRQSAQKALKRDHGAPFGKVGIVLTCTDEECPRFKAEHQGRMIRAEA